MMRSLETISSKKPDHPWAVKMPLGWTCLGPSEPRFLGDVTTAEVHSMIINDLQSYPLNSLLVETNFQNFEENCVIFNAEFDQGLEDLVRKSFDLDELK